MAPKTQTEEHEVVVLAEAKPAKAALTSENFIARWNGKITFPLPDHSVNAVVSYRPID